MSAEVVDGDSALRHACDRCHSQKLRCPRSVSSNKPIPDEPCSRCRKAGSPCVVSLRGKAGRPSKASKKKSISLSTAETSPVPSISGRGSLPHGRSPKRSWNQGNDPVADAADSPAGRPSQRNPLSDASLQQLGCTIPPAKGPEHGAGALNHDKRSMNIDPALDMSIFDLGDDFVDPLDTPSGFLDPASAASLMDTYDDINDTSHVDPLILAPDHMDFDALETAGPLDLAAHAFDLPSDKFFPAVIPEALSRPATYQRLSDLNSEILAAIAGGLFAQGASHMLQQVVRFCGDLIDTARESRPQLLSMSPPPGLMSRNSSSSTSDSSVSSDYDDMSITYDLNLGPLDNISARSTRRLTNPSAAIPDSAVVFLLLSCYSQILRLFEVIISSLHTQHSVKTRPSLGQIKDKASAAAPLLEASLAVQTITYLLSRLQQAFTLDASMGHEDGGLVDEAGGVRSQGWKGFYLGGTESKEGLLGQAFEEMRDRERELMRLTECLQHLINQNIA